MSTFKQFLVEFTENTSSLTSTPEFKKIQSADPEFAGKLEKAWAGDVVDQKRSGAKFDPLFPKMLSLEAHKKFSPKSAHLRTEAQKLQALHSKTFKTQTAAKSFDKRDNDIWSHETQRRNR